MNDPCAGCGHCCSTQGTPPFSWHSDDVPPRHLKWNTSEHAFRYDDELPCLWFDIEARRCKHYEYRPLACRTAVVPGDKVCGEFRTRNGLIPLQII